MAILGILCGIILVLAGISFMATPLATYLATGYIFAIMLLVVGIVGIVNVVRKEADPVTLVAAIPAIIIGIIAIGCVVGYLVYRHFSPDYLEDFDDEFEDDEFEDEDFFADEADS